jgi:hypothetical protein
MTCSLCERRRVEAEVPHFVEPPQDLTGEIRFGASICPGSPSDCNILADGESG